MKGFSLVLRYSLFALLATGINLGTQYLVSLAVPGAYGLYVKMVFGTIAGMVVKYTLDKRFIFYYTSGSRRQEARNFILYGTLSVVTTLVFWLTELLFHRFLPWEGSEYLGALAGLTLGYLLKYRLDKRFVFTKPGKEPQA
ncbi:MAG: GtrA family protein [Spirochaetales bacterium]|nr:GtrA family protein [Spirochaetales bacterium]